MRLLSTLLFVAVWSTQVFAQNILIVDNTRVGEVQPPVYKELQPAIDAAQSGDVIHVMPSVISYGTVTIAKPNLSLFGVGFNPDRNLMGSIMLSKVTNIEIKDGASNIRISGFSGSTIVIETSIDGLLVDKCNFGGVSRAFAVSELNNVIFRNNIFRHFHMGGASTNHFVIKNNIIGGSDVEIDGALFMNNLFLPGGITFDLKNCMVINNIFFTTKDPSAQGSKFINNIINLESFSSVTTFTNNLVNTTPFFENASVDTRNYLPELDFRLKSDSPGKNAGTDGKDIGLFGGETPFEPGGGALPNVQAITAPLTIPAGEDVMVEIRARAY